MALNKKLDFLRTQATPIPGLPSGSPGQLVALFGSFLVNGASAPTGLRGHPVAITRSSAGLYLANLGGLTLATGQYGVKQYIFLDAMLQKGAAGSALRATIGLQVEAAGTFQIRLEDATGTATDLATGTDNRVNWVCVFLNGGK